jgi:hypothetical protein
MKLRFEQKMPGRIRHSVQSVVLEIEGVPATVSELIESIVRICVVAFNRKVQQVPDIDAMDVDNIHNNKLSPSEIDDFAEIGRIAFGITYNNKEENPDIAVANALQCYEDGLYKMFLNGTLLGDLQETIELTEGDCLTVIRLTMLAGRLW